MSWRDAIRTASFRGVSFGVTADTKNAGRRTIIHEFPQREEAYVEDMGASNPRFTLQAFCIGSDYLDKRDQLEQALQKAGSGTLVHPWYGEITVSQAAPYSVTHSAEDGGMCIFTLNFAVDGTPSSPATSINSQGRAISKADFAGSLAVAAFDSVFSIADQVEYVVQNAYNTVNSAIQTVQGIMSGDVTSIASVLGAVSGYDFLEYASLGQRLWGACESIAAQGQNSYEKTANLWLKVANTLSPSPMAENAGSMRQTIHANDVAITSFVRHIALVESAKNTAFAIPESRSAAKILREDFMDTMDSLMLEEDSEQESVQGTTTMPKAMPDSLYVAFTEVRATTLNQLAINAKSTPEVVNYTPFSVLPAEVIAHRLSQDIALTADLIKRNGILHPGFVPVEELEVLL